MAKKGKINDGMCECGATISCWETKCPTCKLENTPNKWVVRFVTKAQGGVVETEEQGFVHLCDAKSFAREMSKTGGGYAEVLVIRNGVPTVPTRGIEYAGGVRM